MQIFKLDYVTPGTQEKYSKPSWYQIKIAREKQTQFYNEMITNLVVNEFPTVLRDFPE